MFSRRRILAVAMAVAAGLGSVQAADAGEPFVAVLTGNQEVPPVNTVAFAFAEAKFFSVGPFELVALWRIDFFLSGPLNPVSFDSGAHIHLARVEENGPVVLPLKTVPTIDLGLIQLTTEIHAEGELVGSLEGGTFSQLRAEIEQGNAYINLHTSENPGGEIRGQLVSKFTTVE